MQAIEILKDKLLIHVVCMFCLLSNMSYNE